MKDFLLRPLRVSETWHYAQRILVLLVIIGCLGGTAYISDDLWWLSILIVIAGSILLGVQMRWVEWWTERVKKSYLTDWEKRLDGFSDQIDERVKDLNQNIEALNLKYSHVTFRHIDDDRLLVTFGDGTETFMKREVETIEEQTVEKYTTEK